MDSQIGAALIGVAGVLAGALIVMFSNQNMRKISSLEKRVEQYSKEILARIDQEEVVIEWLHSLGVGTSPRSAKLLLRDKVEAEKLTRPTFSKSSL